MALPQYRQLKAQLERWFLDLLRHSARQQLGPFAESPRLIQHEGDRHSYNTVNGDERTADYQELAVEVRFAKSDILRMTLEDVLKFLTENGRELGAKEAEFHFGRLNAIMKEAGNVVDGQGRPITFDLYLEMLEKLHIAFDDFGNPRIPTIVVAPHLTQRVEEMLQEAAADEGARVRFETVMEQKRKEWDEEQNRRKLVD
jgi:hypothetical protein